MDIGHRLNRPWHCNRIEQSGIEGCALIEIFGMIGQARNRGLTEPLQLVWFPKGLRRVTQFLANARSSRPGKIFRCLHTTDANRCVRMNWQRSSVGKDKTVEGYAGSLGRRKIALE